MKLILELESAPMTSVMKQYRVIAAIINKSIYLPIVKEKLIKIIQYYTQFLIAYYQNASKEKLMRLRNIQYIMSTCRFHPYRDCFTIAPRISSNIAYFYMSSLSGKAFDSGGV